MEVMIRTTPAARATARAAAALALIAVAFTVSGCAGTTGGEEGPVQVSSAEPADGSAPGLGSATAGGITVSGAALKGTGPGIAVLAQVTAAGADELVSLGSNYTRTTVLPRPLPVGPGTPTTVDATTAVLQPAGPIDDGATVSVVFTFRTAGPIQVFGTYKA